MGWQARLPKDQKPEFVRTCNKCGDTGVKKTFVSMGGQPLAQKVSVTCRCRTPKKEKSITVEIPVPPVPIKEAV